MKSAIRWAAAVAAFAVSASSLGAQGLYFGLRGGAGVPTGTFSDDASGSNTLLAAAKTGFGYGFDAGLQLGMIGVYGGFDHVNFDCESTSCDSDGKYKLQGVAAGLKLIPPGVPRSFQPWIKGGVTFNELKGGFGSGGSSELTTDRNPGYEVAAGLDIPLLGVFRLTPQARYVGQNFKYQVPGVTSGGEAEQTANYYTFDLGLQFFNPLGGMRR